MKVYGHPFSTCTRKVLATLAEKGHKAELVLVDILKGEQKQPAHLARQPFAVIPVLEDDGFTMYESRAICRYLDLKLSGPSLTPHDIHARARMEQWISVESSYFSPTAMKIIWQNYFGKMMGKEPDMAVVAQAKSDLTRSLDTLEHALNGQEYLAGSFSLAEICYLPYIEYLYAAGAGEELIGSRPHLAAWWKRISERPAWQHAIGKA